MKSVSPLCKAQTLLVVFALLIAACSGGETEPDDADSEQTSAPAGDQTDESETVDSAPVDSPDPDGGSGDEDEDGETLSLEPEPGTLVWAHGQEPADLHYDSLTNNLPTTSWIRAPLLEGLYGVDASTSYYPELLAGEAQVTVDEDGTTTIAYTLRDGLTWSDGTALTSADVAYTHEILTEGCEVEADGSIVDGGGLTCVYETIDRTGIDLVTDFAVSGDTRFTVTLANYFPGWRSLYREIYAAHAFGQDAAAVNRNLVDWTGPAGVLPSSGPLVFDTWERGLFLRLVPNEQYHGSTSPDVANDGPVTVEAVQIQFMPDFADRVAAVLDGRVHLLFESARPELAELVEAEQIDTSAVIGPDYEHLGFNVLDTHLAKPAVREAVAYAIDKAELVDEVFGPLFGDQLPPDGQGNAYWMVTQPDYVDNQQRYAGNNVTAAEAALAGAGYTKGSDGVFTHPVDGRLSLRIGTTGGNALREQQQTVLQEQLERAGIELRIDNVAGGAYFEARPFAELALLAAETAGASGDSNIWDITQFGRTGGAWPGGQSASFRVANPNNPYGHANPEFDVRASECDVVIEDADRADCYNELDRFITTVQVGESGLVVVPLTQRPVMLVSRSEELAGLGVALNHIGGGPLANVVDHQLN